MLNNMDYSTAKKLKESGFPQEMEIGDPFYRHGELVFQGEWESDSSSYMYDDHTKLADSYFKAPTLTELIEACGESFNMLVKDPDFPKRWIAFSKNGLNSPSVETPEIAVANLWLALQGKKE
jgi:hypothetical protein